MLWAKCTEHVAGPKVWLPEAALVVAILAFAAFKWSYLDLPYYWDEAWVYAPAVKAMAKSGIGLLPDSLSPDLSRGHPLLFHALAATWTKMFGGPRMSVHLFAMAVSVALCLATYRLGAFSGSRVLGLCAVILLLVNESFLAQSGLLLPEVLLTLFLVLTVNAYLRWRPLLVVLFGVAAVLVKESALAPIAGIVVWQTIRAMFFTASEERPGHFKRLAVISVPLVVAGLYFVIQRIELGWYFFPDHVGLLSFAPKDIAYKANLSFATLFEQQGMVALTYAFALAAPLLHKGMPWWYRLLIPLLFVTAIKVLCGRWTLPLVPTLIVPLVCLGAAHLVQFVRSRKTSSSTAELVMLCAIMVISTWCFASLNFFSERYLLPALPFIAVGGVALLGTSLGTWHARLAPAVALVIAGVLVTRIGSDGGTRDVRLAYADAIRMFRDRIAYCERQDLYDVPIYGSFVQITYMRDPEAGYLSTTRAFSKVGNDLNDGMRHALFDADSPAEDSVALKTAGFGVEAEFRTGSARGLLLRR